MKIHTTHTIDATPAEVWRVLADVDRWPEWNPQMVEAAGALVEGATIDLTMVDPKGRKNRFRPTVDQALVGERLEWTGKLGGIPGLFTGRHWFQLTATDDGNTTRIEQGEEFSGMLVPILRRMLAHLPDTFGSVNRALGQRAAAARCSA